MKNKYRIDGNIVYIELKRKDGNNLETMIDINDFDLVNEFTGSWYAHYDRKLNGFYCIGKITINSKRKSHYLHRIIMDINDPKIQVDHINHNTLDNRKSQLRLVTPSENQWNQKETKGYSWHKRDNIWESHIKINGKIKYLGRFKNEEDAKNSYLEAKNIYHGINIKDKKSDEEIKEFENKFIKEESKGYYYHKKAKKWCSQIVINGKHKYLGLFDNEEDAKKAYLNKREEEINNV